MVPVSTCWYSQPGQALLKIFGHYVAYPDPGDEIHYALKCCWSIIVYAYIYGLANPNFVSGNGAKTKEQVKRCATNSAYATNPVL